MSGFPDGREERKQTPMARGLLDYFPLALAEVAHVSFVGNEQHNPGQKMFWNRGVSEDHADCIMRHLAQRGSDDTDKLSHTAKVAWRALALLQTELEEKAKHPMVMFETQDKPPVDMGKVEEYMSCHDFKQMLVDEED